MAKSQRQLALRMNPISIEQHPSRGLWSTAPDSPFYLSTQAPDANFRVHVLDKCRDGRADRVVSTICR